MYFTVINNVSNNQNSVQNNQMGGMMSQGEPPENQVIVQIIMQKTQIMYQKNQTRIQKVLNQVQIVMFHISHQMIIQIWLVEIM